jgi:hypothetical protein
MCGKKAGDFAARRLADGVPMLQLRSRLVANLNQVAPQLPHVPNFCRSRPNRFVESAAA